MPWSWLFPNSLFFFFIKQSTVPKGKCKFILGYVSKSVARLAGLLYQVFGLSFLANGYWKGSYRLMYIMLDMQQMVLTDICSSWKSFFFKGRKVIWSHPLENVLKSTLGKLWYITPFLKPCILSELLLFIPERFAEHFTEFCHSHFTHVYSSG